ECSIGACDYCRSEPDAGNYYTSPYIREQCPATINPHPHKRLCPGSELLQALHCWECFMEQERYPGFGNHCRSGQKRVSNFRSHTNF
ncbi:hypothetical protein, partial [Endozoicomonas sp. ONNA1]|uniref:hypothetical protein n=1 Tax=Endozoicomonas sp. ONNA1 TaxID=2828740 RepID=UPI0021489A15